MKRESKELLMTSVALLVFLIVLTIRYLRVGKLPVAWFVVLILLELAWSIAQRNWSKNYHEREN